MALITLPQGILQMNVFTDATPFLSDPTALRKQAESEGYLFFKQALPKEPVLSLRQALLKILADHGLLNQERSESEAWPHSRNVTALVRSGHLAYGVGVTHDIYLKIQKLQAFHLF